jgi:hypothetical protein
MSAAQSAAASSSTILSGVSVGVVAGEAKQQLVKTAPYGEQIPYGMVSYISYQKYKSDASASECPSLRCDYHHINHIISYHTVLSYLSYQCFV